MDFGHLKKKKEIDLLEDYKGKIPTFMDRYSGKEKTLYKYNFVGMAINIDNLRDFQRTWQNWSINEEGFPNNLIPLIYPKKIAGQIHDNLLFFLLKKIYTLFHSNL